MDKSTFALLIAAAILAWSIWNRWRQSRPIILYDAPLTDDDLAHIEALVDKYGVEPEGDDD